MFSAVFACHGLPVQFPSPPPSKPPLFVNKGGFCVFFGGFRGFVFRQVKFVSCSFKKSCHEIVTICRGFFTRGRFFGLFPFPCSAFSRDVRECASKMPPDARNGPYFAKLGFCGVFCAEK